MANKITVWFSTKQIISLLNLKDNNTMLDQNHLKDTQRHVIERRRYETGISSSSMTRADTVLIKVWVSQFSQRSTEG